MDTAAGPRAKPLIDAAEEVRLRQELTLVALGKRPADRALRVGRMLDVGTRAWLEDWEIVIKGERIAWVGPAGRYAGEVAERRHEPTLAAVPGFGEVHKHIESSHLTPEWEAALVIPHGNTWTCEASHEFSSPRWGPGFPERLMFATLTCAPWTWVLVAPCKEAPEGFINVQTGEPHPVVW